MSFSDVLAKARKFVYRNARPLDLYRWQYHFEGGPREAVIKALSFYQNTDGGFAHALESDSWNPNSTPIQTWAATEILGGLDFSDRDDSLVKGIVRYLSETPDFNGRWWYRTVPSNSDYPHAPWWAFGKSDVTSPGYNPTAALAGFLLRYADPDHVFYAAALSAAKEAIDHYMHNERPEMHALSCYTELLEHAVRAGVIAIADKIEFRNKLIKDVDNTIEKDPSKWKTTYCCKPSFFISGPQSIFCKGNEELCREECAFLENTQADNGAWDITWQWSDYPHEYAVSANWWRTDIIIKNLLFLKAFSTSS